MVPETGPNSIDAADTLEFGPVSGTKMVFAVLKQDGAQSSETSPFGGDLVGTSAGKWGLKRSGTGILDSESPAALLLLFATRLRAERIFSM